MILALLGVGLLGWRFLRTSAPGDAVTATAPSHQAGSEGAGSRPDQSVGDARVQVSAPSQQRADAAVVQGIVYGPDDAPLAGAKVTLFRVVSVAPEASDVELETLHSGDDGRFRFRTPLQPGLAIGVQVVQADPSQRQRQGRRGESFFQVRPSPASTRIDVSPRIRDQVVKLEHGFVVHGFLRERNGGTPMVDVKVDLALGQFGTEGVRTVRTDAAGYFAFRGVQSGVVGLCAHDPRYAPITMPAVPVGTPKPNWLGFREAGRTLQGRVVAASNTAAIAGARVTAHPLGMQQVVVSETTTDPAGEFKLSGLGAGRFLVVVRHVDWSTQRQVLVVGGDAAPPVFELAPRVAIEGRLTGVLPKEGVPLLLSCESGELLRTRSEEGGRFRFAQKASVGASLLTLEDDQHYFSLGARESIGLQIEERSTNSREFAILRGASIVGQVVDGAGKPVAGARIFAEKKTLWLMSSLRQVAESDLEGRFTVVGMPPGSVTLVALKEGYAKRSVEATGPEGGATRTIDPVRLDRAGMIHGIVVRNGMPCAGAQVLVGSGDVLTVAGLDGRFVLRDVPPGTHELLARYSTVSKQKASSPIEVTPGADVGPIEIVIPGGRTITGEVVDIQGNPVTDALIGIDGDFAEAVFTNPDGTFDLEIPNGDVTLSAMTSDAEAIGFEDVSPRMREKVRIVVPLPPRIVLTAKVLTLPDKKVVSSGILRVEPVGGGFELPGISKLLRSKRSILPRPVMMPAGVLRVERFPVGRMRMVLHCQGFAPFVKEIEAAAGKPIELEPILLEPGARIDGRVVDAQGKPVPSARVIVGEEGDLAFRRIASGGAMTDAKGAFEISGISQHSRRLVVSAPGFATRTIDLVLPRDLLRKEPLVVELGPGSAVKIKVVDPNGAPIAKGAVLLLREGMFVEEALVGEGGIATFPHRTPGTYTVASFGKDSDMVPLEIDAEGKSFDVTLVRKAKK